MPGAMDDAAGRGENHRQTQEALRFFGRVEAPLLVEAAGLLPHKGCPREGRGRFGKG